MSDGRGGALSVPLVGVVLALAIGAFSSAGQPVWVWNQRCGATALLIELRLDARHLSQTVVPICRGPWSKENSALGDGPISFSFTTARAIEWHGYRDREDIAAAGARIAIEIAQVGADEKTLMLAVAASDPVTKAIYVKTVHVARIDMDSATDIARGLTISSSPYQLRPR